MFISKHIFNINILGLSSILIIGFITLCIALFSFHYLDGDRRQHIFYINLAGIVFSSLIIASADHLLLILFAWAINNIFLLSMMLHKKEWNSVVQSTLLALKTLTLGFIFLIITFLIIYNATNETLISKIAKISISPIWLIIISLTLLLTVMTQSALWPFNCWLISSSNSIIPVSAIINSIAVGNGVILLLKFSSIIVKLPIILNIVFIVGTISAILGSIWELIQSDIRRALSYSTMAHMGFIIINCGLGLFNAAIIHLFCHGLFKTYLILSYTSSARESHINLSCSSSIKRHLLALICSIVGTYLFICINNKHLFIIDSTIFLAALTMISCAQISLSIICKTSFIEFLGALILSAIFGVLYGINIYWSENIFRSLDASYPQPLNIIHIFGLSIFIIAWIFVVLFAQRSENRAPLPIWMLKLYVRMLNSGQPHPTSITVHRNHYKL